MFTDAWIKAHPWKVLGVLVLLALGLSYLQWGSAVGKHAAPAHADKMEVAKSAPVKPRHGVDGPSSARAAEAERAWKADGYTHEPAEDDRFWETHEWDCQVNGNRACNSGHVRDVGNSGLNVRSGPDPQAPIVETLPYGHRVLVQCMVDGYYRTPSGKYLSGRHVDLSGQAKVPDCPGA